jgi:hypothetical protein
MNNYEVGDWAHLRVMFVNSGGGAVDPSSVYLETWYARAAPLAVSTLGYGVGSIVRTSTGDYFHRYPCVTPGEVRAHWVGEGDNPGAASDLFKIKVKFN